jgi:predicted AlkP superfamily pyrophosphatase or phosphodiesterase
MNPVPRRLFALAASLVLVIALRLDSRAADPARAPIVILVSVDGLAAFNFDDPFVDVPTIRWMAANGVRAQSMETVFPSVTWPTHTTLVTGVRPGRHGVLGNSYYDRSQNKKVPLLPDPLFDKEEIVKVPTIYDVAQQAGLKTSGVNWPASRNARHLNWQMPDVGDQAIYERTSTPSLLIELKAKGIPFEKQGEWAKAGNLGKAARDWMSAGLVDRTTFFITADHGFADYSKHINLNVLLRNKGLLTTAGTGVVESKVHFQSEGGAGGLYIRDTANRERILAELLPALKSTEGIEVVLPSSEFASIGHVTPAQDAREPDLYVSAVEGYAFADNLTAKDLITPSGGTKGTHGHHPNNRLLDATFVAWGAGIKSGAKLTRIRNVDVAPTMAAVLGLKMENVEGRVLTEILKK